MSNTRKSSALRVEADAISLKVNNIEQSLSNPEAHDTLTPSMTH
jgi:hypothetical protein